MGQASIDTSKLTTTSSDIDVAINHIIDSNIIIFQDKGINDRINLLKKWKYLFIINDQNQSIA